MQSMKNVEPIFRSNRFNECVVQMSAEEYINIWKEFSVRFQSTCHFSFSYINGLTQKSTQNLAAIDLVLR